MSTATGEAVAPDPAAEPPFTGPGEAQQAFLLALSDRVRGLADAGQIMAAAADLLGRHLGLALVQYLLVDADGDGYQVAATYADGRLPRVEAAVGGRGRISAHGPDWGPQFRAGEAVFSDDHDATRSPADAAAQRGVGVRSGSAVPLLRDGRLVAILATGHAAPRRWTEAERELQREVAERTWAAVERARAEAAMRASEARFRLLGEAAPLVVSLARPDGSIEYVNPFWETFSGRTAADFASGDWLEAVHPDDRAAMRAAWDEARATERPYASEFRARAADGTYRWLRAHGTPVRDAAGAVAHWVNVAADVHDRRRAEEVLRASEVRQAFLLTLTDALGPLSDAGEIRLTAAQVLGRHLGANRVAYAEDCGDGVHYDVTPNYVDGLADAAGRYRYADFGADLLADLRAGRTRVQPDIQRDPRLTDAERRALARYGIGASLNVSLVKQGRLVVFLGVNYAAPHDFTPHEIALVREVAERTWGAVERARAEAALRVREEQYRTLFETMGQGYARAEMVRDAAGRAVDVRMLDLNPAYERLMGVPAEVARGRRVYELYPALDRWWLANYDRVVRAGAPERLEYRYTAAGRWYEARVYPRGGDQFDVLFEDVTERKEAEAAVRASEGALRVVTDVVPDLLWRSGPDGTVTWCNARWTAYTGDAPEAALGQSWQYPVHPDDAAASHAEWEAAVAAGRPFRREHRMRAGDGTYRWFLARAEPLRDAGGRPTAEWFGAAADVHAERTTLAEVEWRVAERTAALADANARLAADAAARERARAERDALLRRLAAAQEAERSHLARELHDEVGQHLTAVGLELRALSSVTPPGSEVDRRAAALRDLVGTLGRELHEVAVRLRPRALDDFGLETALEAYAEAWARQSGIPVDLHARVAAERLAPAVESAVYRIVQEALTNVARHSGATRAGVVVERQDGHAVVIVEDDGRGIDDPGLTEAGGPDVAGPDAAGTGGPREGSGPARPGSGGLGLLGIRERATLLGGSVEIESAPGSGTTLFVRIPIEPAAAADKEG